MKVIDNFLHHELFEHIRDEAIVADYIDWLGPDKQLYKRICIIDNPFVKEQIEEDLKTEVDMLGMAYRLNYIGEEPNQSIHTDVGWGTHALVLYLNDGPSGTAFWKHKKSETTRLKPLDITTYIATRKDWTDNSKWELDNFVKMEANRAVIYESELFHSRYPFEAFGTKPEDGRLILVAFFTPKEK